MQRSIFAAVALIVWQLVDIILHVAASKIEPLRVASNIILMIAAGACCVEGMPAIVLNGNTPHKAIVLIGTTVVYLILNIVAWAVYGDVAAMFFVLVILSLLLSSLESYLIINDKGEEAPSTASGGAAVDGEPAHAHGETGALVPATEVPV